MDWDQEVQARRKALANRNSAAVTACGACHYFANPRGKLPPCSAVQWKNAKADQKYCVFSVNQFKPKE